MVNYQLLHMCSPSGRIIGWVMPVMIELLNGWEAFYLKVICWKKYSIHFFFMAGWKLEGNGEECKFCFFKKEGKTSNHLDLYKPRTPKYRGQPITRILIRKTSAGIEEQEG